MEPSVMELPTQSGMRHSFSDTGVESDDDETPSRAQIRKSNKPLLEKKRRARINRSLEQLKGLVLEALKKDSARYSKLEKADILEMTVKHLREIQRQQMSVAMSMDPTVTDKYRSGFGECAHEVNRYLGTIDGLTTEVRMRLMQHLSGRITQMTSYPSPVYGMPCATSPNSLPGVGIRCGLPFGGLALPVTESPTLPVSPDSIYSPQNYRYSDVTVTPKSHSRDAMTSRKRDYCDSENIAPSPSNMPLAEKNGNTNRITSPCETYDFGDKNNNVYALLAKRQRVEIMPNSLVTSDFRQQSARLFNRNIGQNLLDVKIEPVWRPW